MLYLAYNSQCEGTDLPKGEDLGQLFDYIHPKDALAKGTGAHELYVMMLRQQDKFDNDVAGMGMRVYRLREDGIFGNNEDVSSYTQFNITKFKNTYNLVPIYISKFMYDSKFCSFTFFFVVLTKNLLNLKAGNAKLLLLLDSIEAPTKSD